MRKFFNGFVIGLLFGAMGYWVAQSNIFSEQVRDKMLHELNRRTQLADPARLTIQEEADSPVV